MPSQAYFNNLFSLYAPLYPIVSSQFNKSRKNVIRLLEERLESIAEPKVLLVGAGDGIDIPFFKEGTSITYLDASKGMYRKARKKFGGRSNITFIHSDFLQYEEVHEFDLVCIHFCLSVTENPSSVIDKASSLLTKSGLLSIIDISKPIRKRMGNVVNRFTKWSMFNLKLDIEELIKETNAKYSLIQKADLQEYDIFASFIYNIEENE